MPHIAVAMLPGRSREKKELLAQKLKACLIEELGVDQKFVSVSVEEVELKDWDAFYGKIPAEGFIVKPAAP